MSTTHTPVSAHTQAEIVTAAAAQGTWTLDAGSSEVAFRVKNFWGLAKVRGTFKDVDGSAQVDAGGSITGALTIRAASVDTGQAKRDRHLASADFFDAERHPTMRVHVRGIQLRSAEAGTAAAQVTILGQTQPVSFDVALARQADGRAVAVTGEVTLDRRQFGMTWGPMGMASMDVAVTFRLVYRAPGA